MFSHPKKLFNQKFNFKIFKKNKFKLKIHKLHAIAKKRNAKRCIVSAFKLVKLAIKIVNAVDAKI